MRSAQMRLAIYAAGIIVLVAASLRFLHEPYYGYIWELPVSGWAATLPITVSAAVGVWIFWGFAATVIAGLILHANPKTGLFDAIFAGVAGAWIFAYVAGNLLGPLGLFRGWTIWLVMLVAAAALMRNARRPAFHRPSAGLQLALLACALIAIGVLPMQLGSPVPPYMDVLNNPASAQRIVTFHRYLPWDNDPYGHWGPGIQTPGLELFYAMLAMGSATPLAVLAEMAAALPMMCLIALATWRLGRALVGDSAGGFAALLLFATTIFMRGVQMRGTALAFVLVAGGLGFFLDRERRPMRTALGALMLGSAFASHAIDAALGFAVAYVAVVIELLDGDVMNPVREALCLGGALLIAVPEFAVALTVRVPYPILPACQIAGIAVIWLAARGVTPRLPSGAAARWTQRGVLAATLVIFALYPSGITSSVHGYFPILTAFCMAGLVLAAVDYQHSGGIWVAAMALALADAMQYVVAAGLRAFPSPQAQFGLNDIVFKLQEYWSPYFLVFPAAIIFDWAYRYEWSYRRWSRPLIVAALLAFLVFPWSEHPERDLNYNEHPLADQWAVNWQTAKSGWWLNSPDHRWLQSPDEFALIEKLRGEIAAGRITPATHVIHVAPESVIWKDELLYSLYTGIDDDLYVTRPDGDPDAGPSAGSRMHPIARLPDALAAKPPYLVIYRDAPASLKLPPPGYEEIFRQGEIRLFRRQGLGAQDTAEVIR